MRHSSRQRLGQLRMSGSGWPWVRCRAPVRCAEASELLLDVLQLGPLLQLWALWRLYDEEHAERAAKPEWDRRDIWRSAQMFERMTEIKTKLAGISFAQAIIESPTQAGRGSPPAP